MQRILSLLFLLLACTSVRAQKETAITSAITNATVFLEGAQVNRKAESAIPAGRSTLVFTGLTADMDPQSIQVKAGDEALVVLSVSQRLNFNKRPEKNPAADKLYDQIEALDDRKALLSTQFQIAREEEDILKANRLVAGQQNGLSADELKQTVAYHRERITAIRMLYLSITDSLETVLEEREKIQEQLSELGKQNESKATAEIVVVTQSEKASSSDFVLTYLVPNARWVPHYDIRVTDLTKPVDLRYRAKVSQSSGEDWTNVRLKLSTGDPSANGVAPTLPMWRITNNSRPPTYRPEAPKPTTFGYSRVEGRLIDEAGQPMIGASILIQGTAIGTVTDFDGIYRLEVPANAKNLVISYVGYDSKVIPVAQANGDIALNESSELLDEVVVTGSAKLQNALQGRAAGVRMQREKKRDFRSEYAQEDAPVPVTVQRRATTVNFDIELPYSIPSDGKPRDVEIKQHNLPATYQHLAVPKFTPDAYLTAEIKEWEQYNLLSGEVQLFFEGTYLGVSKLDVANTSDVLEISLGKDPGIVIERQETDDSRKKNLFGSRTTQTREYKIKVRNTKEVPVNLTILDQVPISGDENIDIKPEIASNFQMDTNTGILTWKQELGPKKEVTAVFGYSVRFPNNYRVVME
ncbi:DUF4139 domain-containing protein [Neolewinella persica]|uniref:DUF4139 domain-containing protein n=1 Tax=Neolewinella persica TaxID=70998 RepID=UPI00037468FC|nr:mucoidy inhibitor MuiA family protein [Neolewinella persica]